METILTLTHISKTFGAEHHAPWGVGRKRSEDLQALADINLEIMAGEIFVFLGPSGSGKSTLLRIMSGLERSYKGEVRWIAHMAPIDISFVFQQFALLPWLTVSQNVELGLHNRNVSFGERTRRVNNALKHLGLEKFSDAAPKDLSGGMRQRVGIARALVTAPKVIFMDEPFSELDSFTAQELRKEMLRIWAGPLEHVHGQTQRERPTIVMVTHIIEEALELADRIAVLTPQPGKIEKIVHNTLPRPRDKRSADFFRFEDDLYRLIKP
ncbi:MAG: ABC transporter ATP-binding protein [Candidatus Sungbacteria bacterium]|nr:ABC transporter ATP-binding protein [Candidatus Sungbacteria bacterium]